MTASVARHDVHQWAGTDPDHCVVCDVEWGDADLTCGPASSAASGVTRADGEGQNRYIDDNGVHYGYCNACGEESELDQACTDPDCDEGEVVPYDDDPNPDGAR